MSATAVQDRIASAVEDGAPSASTASGSSRSRWRGSRLGRLVAAAAMVPALAAVPMATSTPSASAAIKTWYSVPGTGPVSGSAIIDGHYKTSDSRIHAYGRVVLRLNGGCGYIKYASFLDWAVDGSYRKLTRYCGTGTVTISWSDWWYMADGVKFQACSDVACGSERHIYW